MKKEGNLKYYSMFCMCEYLCKDSIHSCMYICKHIAIQSLSDIVTAHDTLGFHFIHFFFLDEEPLPSWCLSFSTDKL